MVSSKVEAPVNVLAATQKMYFQDDVLKSNERMRALLPKLAKLYASVFADPPWNELKVCDRNHYVSKIGGDRTKCAQCGGELRPAYPESEVIQKIFSAMEKNGCLTVFKDAQGTLLGAAWGFVCSSKELQKHYDSEEMKALVETTVAPYIQEDRFFYLSEVFVETDARNNGFGTTMTKTLVDRAVQLKLSSVLRTHIKSPMAGIAKKLAMNLILAPGQDTDYEGRILFARRWGGF